MARASATSPVVEQCWTLVGQRRGRVWLGRRIHRVAGEHVRVRFDGPWVLRREETRGDVLGFLHTHPDGPPMPSQRDIRTMRAWCSAFGKPLLCLIQSPEGLKGYRFADDQSSGEELEHLEAFPRGVLIGVEADDQ